MKNVFTLFIILITGLSVNNNAHAAPTTKKEVRGRILLCDTQATTESVNRCNHPSALNTAVLDIRFEGKSTTSKIVADGRGHFRVLNVPGRYVVTVASNYEKKFQSFKNTDCHLVSFPEKTTSKILVVGPENKRKDLYFTQQCD